MKAVLLAGLLAIAGQANANCLVLGDSIAVGISAHLKCARVAKVGMNTDWIARHAPNNHFDAAVISAGSNDWGRLQGLAGRLQRLRDRVDAKRIVWVLPAISGPRTAVALVAKANGDQAVSFIAGNDHVHPRHYGALSRRICLDLWAK